MGIQNLNFKLPPLIIIPIWLFLIMLCPTAWSTIPDGEALLKFKKTLGDPDVLRSWVPNTSPCQDKAKLWEHILCYEGAVMGVRLHALGLLGTIDMDALSNLPSLRTISFEGNKFSGPIPEFDRLGALKTIYISHNEFSGPIPSDYFSKLKAVKKLWLNNNKLSGEIPSSLTQLKYLQELHLENNNFTGKIPPLHKPPLMVLNLSNNQLDGEIPSTLSMFNASSFGGNLGLCGGPLGNVCGPEPVEPGPNQGASGPPAEAEKDNHKGKTRVVVIIIGVSICFVVLVLLACLFLGNKKKKANKGEIPTANKSQESKKKGMNEGAVEVEMTTSALSRKESSSSTTSSRKSNASRRSSARGGSSGGGIGDLTMVNDSKGSFGMSDLMTASAEVLGNGGMGSAYKAVMANGVGVAVKRMRELNRLEKEGFEREITKLAAFRHPNVLPPLAYHYRKEEKLIVYEYVGKGSLHYILHGDRGSSHAELTWPTRLNIIKGVTKGLQYLHAQLGSYEVPHGNLKSSNILINLENEAILSDYGFNALANPNTAAQALFAYKSPETIQNPQNISSKCDIYSLGVVILEILTGKFPSQYLSSTKGGTDVVQWVVSAIEEGREAGLLDPDMASKSPDASEHMVRALHLGVNCANSDPKMRPGLKEIMEKIKSLETEGGDHN